MLLAWLAIGCIPVLHSDRVEEGPWTAPTNSWPVCEPDAGQTAEGFDPGQVAPDWRLPDQFGAEVSLWQFSCNVVILDISTMWCAPCQELAGGLQETADAYADQGFVYVTVLRQDMGDEVPDTAELEDWAGNFGITEPILADSDHASDPLTTQGYPVVYLLAPGMIVEKQVTPATDTAIRDAVENLL